MTVPAQRQASNVSVRADEVRLADLLLDDGAVVVTQIRRGVGSVTLVHDRRTQVTMPNHGLVRVRRVNGRLIDHDVPACVYSSGWTGGK